MILPQMRTKNLRRSRPEAILSKMVEAEKSAVYSIGAVARMLGVPPTTIRTWEERYGLIVPQRSSGGQRLFSRQQVEHLRFVKDRLDAGMQPADAHRLLAGML